MSETRNGPTIDFRTLKRFALEKLRETSPLRDVILSEPDKMSTNDFLAKLPIWLRLAKFENRRYESIFE